MIGARRPRAIAGNVFAMARPRRPDAEREAVLAAAAIGTGSMAQRARRIAAAVARQAMADVDGEAGARVSLLLDALARSPTALLATDPDIDTAAAIRDERVRRLEARAGRRLPEREWAAEDTEILRVVVDQLAKRYARHLARFQP